MQPAQLLTQPPYQCFYHSDSAQLYPRGCWWWWSSCRCLRNGDNSCARSSMLMEMFAHVIPSLVSRTLTMRLQAISAPVTRNGTNVLAIHSMCTQDRYSCHSQTMVGKQPTKACSLGHILHHGRQCIFTDWHVIVPLPTVLVVHIGSLKKRWTLTM